MSSPSTLRVVSSEPSPPIGLGWLVLILAVTLLLFLLLVPVIAVFLMAFRGGLESFWAAITHHDTRQAIRLTLAVVGITVPLNTLFGLAAAWAITKHDFRGKSLLLSWIDVPFTVSPVVAGLLFVLLFGAQGVWGPWLNQHEVRVIYALPGIVLATLFVTLPYVARELIPLMEAIGVEEELAALSLGANGWRTFWRITIPNIRWGLLHGCLVCAARALGEFGAVSVVSGHIRGETNTLPLHVEVLYNEYNQQAAFAVASLLTGMSLLTVIGKSLGKRRYAKGTCT